MRITSFLGRCPRLFHFGPLALRLCCRPLNGGDLYSSCSDSRCRVGASAPRCRVVPSVTLGGVGISWAVLRGGSAFKGCRDEIVSDNVADDAGKDLFCWTCTICETPLPNKAKAGISIQNHQTCPPISLPNKPMAIATRRKPMPMDICLMPSAIVGVPLCRRLRRAIRGATRQTQPGWPPEVGQSAPVVRGLC